jgi:hypothetical protein
MDNAVIAKDLATITRARFSKLSSGTEQCKVQGWILQKCAEELLETIGGIDCDAQEAYLAELAISGGTNANEDCSGEWGEPVASEDGARVTEASSISDAFIQRDLFSIAERHLQAGFECMSQGECECTRSADFHFRIINAISSSLNEPRQLYLIAKTHLFIAESNLRESKAGMAQAEEALREAEVKMAKAEQAIAEGKQTSGEGSEEELAFSWPGHSGAV